MPTLISTIEARARQRLQEPVARFWSSDELVGYITDGIRDLWRDIADLKQEHFLKVDPNVLLIANTSQLSNVPIDVHKIYNIEPLNLTINGSNNGLIFRPLDYNDQIFSSSRSRTAIDPQSDTIYYAITASGGPVDAPIIRIAPQVTSNVTISFSYVPTLGDFTANSMVPIPGEADNALIAWCVAYARGKETETRAPDSNWLSIYATEKQHLLQSLGLRQYQEPSFSEALFQDYWP